MFSKTWNWGKRRIVSEIVLKSFRSMYYIINHHNFYCIYLETLDGLGPGAKHYITTF